MPKLDSAGRALMRASSCCSTRFSSIVSPPPPYCFGHIGHVQPFSAIRVSQTLDSGIDEFFAAAAPDRFVFGARRAHRRRAVGCRARRGFRCGRCRDRSRALPILMVAAVETAILAALHVRLRSPGHAQGPRSHGRARHSDIVRRVRSEHGDMMAGSETAFDGRTFRNTLGQFCTGVVVATGVIDGTARRDSPRSRSRRCRSTRRWSRYARARPAPVGRSCARRAASASTCCRRNRKSCAINSRSRDSSPTSVGAPGVTGSPVLDRHHRLHRLRHRSGTRRGRSHHRGRPRARSADSRRTRRAAVVFSRHIWPFRDVHLD